MATTVINLSSLDGTNGFRLNGVAEGDLSGYSVSNAGDINAIYFVGPKGRLKLSYNRFTT